jgi:hypothetical protein
MDLSTWCPDNIRELVADRIDPPTPEVDDGVRR